VGSSEGGAVEGAGTGGPIVGDSVRLYVGLGDGLKAVVAAAGSANSTSAGSAPAASAAAKEGKSRIDKTLG
jgi:hypothetical protein